MTPGRADGEGTVLLEIARQTIAAHQMADRGDRVLVAVSGGRDSVALLDVLAKLQYDLGIELHIAHLNHRLRPEAEQEAEFVRALAGAMRVPLTVESADVRALAEQQRLSIEHAARNARRDFLLRTADAAEAARIALGHHADDRVETVLQRLLRGTGLEGLAGIRPVADRFIRPLFDANRAHIGAYVAEHGLAYREDPSNRDPAFLRNRVRWELLPLLERMQPGARSALLRLSELAAEEAGWLRERGWSVLARAVVEREPERVVLRLAPLRRQALPVQRRVIRAAARLLLGETMEIEHTHVEAAVGLLRRGRTGAQVHLPRRLTVGREYDQLIVRVGLAPRAPEVGEYVLAAPGETEVAALGIIVSAQLLPREQAIPPTEEPPHVAQLDYAALTQPLTLRTWRRGDRFQPLGMAGSMKVHDFFVNHKVPRARRSRVPIVTAGGDIAWVVGYRLDDRFKVTPQTETVLRLEVRPP